MMHRHPNGPAPRGEHGASAVVFILSFFVLLAAGLLAIDGGFLWLSQRGQVADTDAAALAAARALAEDECAADSTAQARADTIIGENDTATSRDSFSVNRSSACAEEGYVVLTTRRDSVQIFAGAFGFGDTPTAVTSAARYGYVPAPTGVRPITICDKSPHYVEWADYLAGRTSEAAYLALAGSEGHPPYAGATVVHRFPYDITGECGDAAGNWGLVDFPDENNSLDRIAEWLQNGYEPGVDITGPDCDAADPEIDDCSAGPGVRASLERSGGALEAIQCAAGLPWTECEVLYFVVYDVILDGDGNVVEELERPLPAGEQAYYNFTNVVGLVLRGYELTGGPDGRYLDLEFVDSTYTGPVGDVPDDYTGPRGASLCGAGPVIDCTD